MIGVTYIPGNNNLLQNIKESFARQINRLEKLRPENNSNENVTDVEINQLIDAAQAGCWGNYLLAEQAYKLK